MSDETRLLDLLDSWQEARAKGQPVSAQQLCGSRGDLVPLLEERIAILQRLQKLGAAETPAERGDQSTGDFRDTDAQPPLGPTAKPDTPQIEGFELLGVLGEGGFGTVYRAEDTRLKRKVAVKLLHPQATARPDAQEQFLREAQALAAIQNDHVVPIYQVGIAQQQLFLAMPLLAGETLAARLEREGALPIAEVLRIAREIATGLVAIHAKVLVHRDLKPGNIWLEAGTGRVKVLDLGLAQAPTDANERICGTPPYMSPEQTEGRPLDARSDLFSLGCVLYECAGGKRPFMGASIGATLSAVREQTPTPLNTLNPGVPAPLADLITHLLAKDPLARPASAAAVLARLQAIPPTSQTPARRPRGWLVVVLGIGLVLMAFMLWGVLQHRPKDSTFAPTPTVTETLRVSSFNVRHFAARENNRVEALGTIGESSFAATLGDEFDVQAKLSRPAYSYIIAYRPDGMAQVIFPQDGHEVPPLTDQPHYPATRRDERYVLEEGHGLWVIALVTSERPLPSVNEWLANHTLVRGWQKHLGERGTVWRDDGVVLDTLRADGRTRGDRASKQVLSLSPMVRLTDELRSWQMGPVSLVGFTVLEKR